MLSHLLFTAVAALAAPASHRGDQWVADWDAAAKLAKESGKDLFVDFTGSDWCGWCIKLHEEVFAHEEFLKGVGEQFVLVALDYPQGDEAKAKVPNPERNAELAKQHKIGGYPTILLMTADGEVFGRTGYREGGAAPYVTHVAELRTSGKAEIAEAKEFEAKFAAATGEEQLKLLDVAIEKLMALAGESPATAKFSAIARHALTLDADNKAGRKLKAIKALLHVGDVTADVVGAARELDPKNENGLLEKVVLAETGNIGSEEELKAAAKKIDDLDALGPMKDKEVAMQLYVNAAFWNFQFIKNVEVAKKYSKKVSELGLEINPRLQQLLDRINGS